jgi:hypothetical protein
MEDATGKVEREFDVTSKTARQVDELFKGLSSNLNHDKYALVIVGHSQEIDGPSPSSLVVHDPPKEVTEVDAQYPGGYVR